MPNARAPLPTLAAALAFLAFVAGLLCLSPLAQTARAASSAGTPAAPPGGASTPSSARAVSAPGTGGGTADANGAGTKSTSSLPPARSADALMADVVNALGGATAMARHKSMHTKMEITFKGLGISGTAEHYGAAGDRALTITEIPNMASTREGSDGKRFWSEDPINGLRILDGVEAEQARAEVAWNAELRMKELFPKIEVVNERKNESKNDSKTAGGDDGSYLECLVLSAKQGPPLTNCFDSKTHLMQLQRGVRSGPQGAMPFTARLSDWRALGDIKIAYATDMQVGPLAFAGRVTLAELDIPVDPALFEVPKSKATKSKATKQTQQTKQPKAGRKGPDTSSQP